MSSGGNSGLGVGRTHVWRWFVNISGICHVRCAFRWRRSTVRSWNFAGRDDAAVFGAQAVNAYVDQPRMTQDVDILSPRAAAPR